MDFVEKARIMDGRGINRALSRLASEIVEENPARTNLYLVAYGGGACRWPSDGR